MNAKSIKRGIFSSLTVTSITHAMLMFPGKVTCSQVQGLGMDILLECGSIILPATYRLPEENTLS